MMKKIFFVTYGGGHVNLLVPVIHRLMKKPIYEIVILGLSIAGNVLDREKIPYKTYRDYIDRIKDDVSDKWGEIFANEFHVEGKGLSKRDTAIYYGISMRDLIQEKGEQEALRIFTEEGRRCFFPVQTLKKILNFEKPNLIVTGNVPRSEKAAVRAGKEMGIPTLSIHDHLGFEERHHLEADKIAVMCEITRDNLMHSGHDPMKIVITGQPAFDSIQDELRRYDRREILSRWELPESKKFVLLATEPDATTERMVNATVAACRELHDFELIVKPHPGEDARLHRKWLKYYQNVHFREQGPVRELIFVSEIVIVFFSTVGLESILMGKPLVQLNLTGKPNPIPLFKFGTAQEVTHSDKLLRAIKDALFDKNIKYAFALARSRYFSPLMNNDGADNIVSLIEEMIA